MESALEPEPDPFISVIVGEVIVVDPPLDPPVELELELDPPVDPPVELELELDPPLEPELDPPPELDPLLLEVTPGRVGGFGT
jgi:pilus assembly protein FimV